MDVEHECLCGHNGWRAPSHKIELNMDIAVEAQGVEGVPLCDDCATFVGACLRVDIPRPLVTPQPLDPRDVLADQEDAFGDATDEEIAEGVRRFVARSARSA